MNQSAVDSPRLATPPGDQLVRRSPTSLRPHPVYQKWCGTSGAEKVRRLAEHPGSIREPLLVTRDGTILDGHARWRVALARQIPTLPCLVCDLTEEDQLRTVIERHRGFKSLNAFCRIMMALTLEPYYRRNGNPLSAAALAPSSNLTDTDSRDVRKMIAGVANASTGNVTKVKQLLPGMTSEVRDALARGDISIHRAWGWRELRPARQRETLWRHLNNGETLKTVRQLVLAHKGKETGASTGSADVAATVVGGLANYVPSDLTVEIVEVPGKAILVTREFYEDLLTKCVQ